MSELPKNVSESVRKLNPHLYGLGAVAPTKRERSPVSALDQGGKQRRKRSGSVVIRVAIISCRHREVDRDSNIYSLKPIQDAISASLGIDDGDARIRFYFGQVEDPGGEEGLIVKITQTGGGREMRLTNPVGLCRPPP
jgi:hypothetical protein